MAEPMGNEMNIKVEVTRTKTGRRQELGHDPILHRIGPPSNGSSILEIPLLDLRPSKLNDSLYKPVDPDDPDLRRLAENIQQQGILDPLVISADNVIISGHRRHAAAQLVMESWQTVPCLRRNIQSTDPEFLQLLRDHNRQRVKTAAEMIRERVLDANPEEAHRVLVEHRQKVSEVSAETIELEQKKNRAKISNAKAPFLDAIRNVFEQRRTYWPLTDRQIHYALLNDPPLTHASKPDSRYLNDPKCYKSLTELLTRARLEGHIPFNAIHDPTRPVDVWNFPQHVGEFIERELDGFLKQYYRDLMQSQPNQIEIVGEKNTIASIIRPIASNYSIPLTIGRGYSSLDPRYRMAQRFGRSGKEKLIVLALSDFDPEGENIAESFARSLRDDFGIENVVGIKVALTLEQVERLSLPPKMKAKKSSSRYKGFCEKYGDDVYELEALPPSQLQAFLQETIDSILDTEAFNAETDKEKAEAAQLDVLRTQAHELLGNVGEEWCSDD